jgi:hypothetical protein
MSLFEEIYGFEDSPKPSTVKPKALPATQLDDWRWQITPATSSAAATCRKIEDAAFTKAILGGMPMPVVPESEPELFIPPALVKFADKVERLQKRASERGPAITNIIDECLEIRPFTEL